MSEHFDRINTAVSPLFINMMRGDDAGVETGGESTVVVDEEWDDLQDAPIQEDREDLAGKTGGDEDEVVQDDEGNAAQVPKGLPEPKPPSIEAQRRHELTHWPYAIWCPYCVMGRRNNSPHFRSRGGARNVPLLVLDYCFVRTADESDLVTVLVAKLYPVRRAFACILDMKATDAYAVARLSGVHQRIWTHQMCVQN